MATSTVEAARRAIEEVGTYTRDDTLSIALF
jgi:hypothetical protein